MQAAGGLALSLSSGIGASGMAKADAAPASASDLDPARFKTRFAPVGDGVDLAYVREGAGGVTLLLLHGWPWSKRLWWRNIGPLAAAGFDVIVPDQRGTGESTVPKNPLAYVSMAQSAIDCRNLLAHLGIERAVLVGADFGYGVVQDMSIRFPGLAIRQCGFNGPSPHIPELFHAAGIGGDQISEVMAVSNHVTEGGLHADALAERYNTDDKRRDFIASHYLTEMPGVGGDGEQRLGRGLEQDGVDLCLVLVGDVGDRRRQREDHMVVGHQQELGRAVGQPFLRRRTLALRAMAVAAGIVGDAGMVAFLAARDMAAERRRAAALDRRHHLQLVEADMAGMGLTPCRTMVAEDIRNLQGRARHARLGVSRAAGPP
jgi:pimeloyl-ACP methyl ester carboxylesterase